jgi:hypothetical protein
MVAHDAATILAHRSRPGKRRVHFIRTLWCLFENGVDLPHDRHRAGEGRLSHPSVCELVRCYQLLRCHPTMFKKAPRPGDAREVRVTCPNSAETPPAVDTRDRLLRCAGWPRDAAPQKGLGTASPLHRHSAWYLPRMRGRGPGGRILGPDVYSVQPTTSPCMNDTVHSLKGCAPPVWPPIMSAWCWRPA